MILRGEGSMKANPNVAVVIPAFNPDDRMVKLLEEIVAVFAHVVVVDDGSSSSGECFRKVESAGAVLLRHPVNRGKGAALKTAFAWIVENLPDCRIVVTADADGQHTPCDIGRVADVAQVNPDALVLGVRSFSGKVPFRSRFGNWWTRQIFFVLTRLRISDTQTGLRAIPVSLLPRMIGLDGERYEYEMRMLLDAKNHPKPPVQVPIDTVYIAGNASSHFNPLKDSVRIYGALGKFCVSSITCFILDNVIFTAVLYAFARLTDWKRATGVFVAILVARAISATANYCFNRSLVFRSNVAKGKSFAKYWTLVLVIMALGYLFTAGLSRIIDAHGLLITTLKIVVETFLFFLSYNVQKRWIFKSRF